MEKCDECSNRICFGTDEWDYKEWCSENMPQFDNDKEENCEKFSE